MFVFMCDKFISDRLFDNRIKEWINIDSSCIHNGLSMLFDMCKVYTSPIRYYSHNWFTYYKFIKKITKYFSKT